MTVIEDHARSVFLAALERAPDQWPAFLDEACGDDAEVRARVDQLLQAHQALGSIHGGGTEAPATIDAPVTEGPGTVIGPYKRREPIGEGGMGKVWMAQQTEPVKRVVALKLIKAGMDSKQVIARFEAERQALALMEHPSIARVLDAGTTSAGRPYFVMDLVKGMPITRYCDEHRLTPRQRLELFIPVCHAIQHAHQKGIIHRDLKPSNVLIALYDGKPVPKVIDFGVAKAAGQPLTEKTLVTGFGMIVGTLEYMSPEQAEINQLDIDTRSDIYSLGVLLYELLTGSTPFSRKDLEKAGMLEMLRVIREQEPSKPSTKLSTAEGLPTLAANRGTEPAKLTKLVRGELDWIVMKALEKDRNRRYETANGFAMDVQRYLADEPVLAGPPSAWYRLRKFVRRNKGPVLAACLVVLALVAGILGTTAGLLRARAAAAAVAVQHHRAERNLHRALDAVEQMLMRVGEERLQDVPQMEHVRRELLEDALKFYQQLLEEEGDDAALRLATGRACRVVADIYGMLGQLDLGLQHYAQAQELLDGSAVGEDYRYQLAVLHRNRGRLLDNKGRFAEAKQDFDRAVGLLTRLAADHADNPAYRRDLATSFLAVGGLLPKLDRPTQEAIAAHRQAQSILMELVNGFPEAEDYRYQLAAVHRNLITLAARSGRYQEVRPAAREALDHLEVLLNKRPRKTAYRRDQAYVQLVAGNALANLHQLKEAREFLTKARDAFQRLAADFPEMPDYQYSLAGSHHNLANIQRRTGEFEEAKAGYRGSIAVLDELIKRHPDVVKYRDNRANSYAWLGNCLKITGQLDEAEKELSHALKLFRELADEFKTDPRHRVQLAGAYSNLGECLHRQGRSAEAAKRQRQAIPLLEELVAKYTDESKYLRDLANAYLLLAVDLTVAEQDRVNEAFQNALAGWEKLVAKHPATSEYRLGLGSTLARMGNHAQAAKEADECARRASNRSDGCFCAARVLSLCVSSMEKADKLTAAERQRLAHAYAERAMAYLREAIAQGLPNVTLLQYEVDLKVLQDREDFRQLLRDQANPIPPKR